MEIKRITCYQTSDNVIHRYKKDAITHCNKLEQRKLDEIQQKNRLEQYVLDVIAWKQKLKEYRLSFKLLSTNQTLLKELVKQANKNYSLVCDNDKQSIKELITDYYKQIFTNKRKLVQIQNSIKNYKSLLNI